MLSKHLCPLAEHICYFVKENMLLMLHLKNIVICLTLYVAQVVLVKCFVIQSKVFYKAFLTADRINYVSSVKAQ